MENKEYTVTIPADVLAAAAEDENLEISFSFKLKTN